MTDRGVLVHVREADPEQHRAMLRNEANLQADLGPTRLGVRQSAAGQQPNPSPETPPVTTPVRRKV